MLYLSCQLWTVSAQEQIWYFHHLSSSNILASNTYNYAVYQDQKGYIWISSILGLTRYDGIHYDRFIPHSNLLGATKDKHVQSPVFEDTSGKLWLNTSNQLYFFDPEEYSFHSVPVYYKPDSAYADFQVVHYDSTSNSVWFLAQRSLIGNQYPLYRMDVDDTNQMVQMDSIASYLVDGLKVFPGEYPKEQYFCIPQRKGWEIRHYSSCRRVDSMRFIHPTNEAFTSYCFLKDQDEQFWIGTSEGLLHTNFAGTSMKYPPRFKNQTIKGVRGVVPLDSDHLIIATEEMGIYIFDKHRFRYLHKIVAFQGEYVTPFEPAIQSVSVDRDKNLWVVTKSQGVYFTNPLRKRFGSFLQKRIEAPQNNNIRAVSEDNKGVLWCLTDERVITLAEDGRQTPPSPSLKQLNYFLQDKAVYYLTFDQEGWLWLCTNTGLIRWKDQAGPPTFIQPCDPAIDERPVFTYIRCLKNGRMFASSYGRGMYEVLTENNNSCMTQVDIPFDTTGRFTMIFEDHAGRVWLSEAEASFQVYEPRKEGYALKQAMTFSPMVNAIAEDTISGSLWLGTNEGLFSIRLEEDSFRLQQDALFSTNFPVVNGLQYDEQQRMWISTNKGIVLYSPLEQQQTESLAIPQDGYRVFNVQDGLPNEEFNFWSYARTANGKLAFGGVNGVAIVEPQRIQTLPWEATPTITKITINDKPLAESKNASLTKPLSSGKAKLILKPSVRSFRLDFAAMEYGHTGENQFYYTLAQSNGEIVQKGNEPFASYFNLKPGNYILTIFAANVENHWNTDEPYVLELKVKRHWTKTWWFYGLIAMLVIFIAGWLVRNRFDRLQRKQQIAELETAILRLQLNPHFIFNSLNSIRGYIQEREIDTADSFLVKLARLIRKILDIADKPAIPLYDECHLLEEYMKIETLRFENAFTYKVVHLHEMDLDDILIPTMILQPFVENAIIHAFRGKTERGLITVEFDVRDDMLLCRIIDNGVGRNATKTRKKEHESKATIITKERLELLAKQRKKATYFHIEDRYNASQLPEGTTVHIHLPL